MKKKKSHKSNKKTDSFIRYYIVKVTRTKRQKALYGQNVF